MEQIHALSKVIAKYEIYVMSMRVQMRVVTTYYSMFPNRIEGIISQK